ncbi:MAG: RES family NAD+ phosphorylase [Caldimonas sp.]
MALDPQSVPLTRVSWRPSYRLIPSRYPTVGLYDAIADAADLDAVFAIEALANPRLRDEIGELQLVPPAERVSGPGATPVMAAFTHLNPEGSRFSNGSYGVYYAAHSLATAVAEVSHHRALFLRRTDEPAIDLDQRLITANVEAELHDLGKAGAAGPAAERFAAALDPDDYGPSQGLGRALREAGSWGVRYPSVRDAGGECVAIFRPRALRHAEAAAHIALHWDGLRITHWYEKRRPQALGD